MARLIPTQTLADAVPALLAADPATLAPPVLTNHVHLMTEMPVPGPGLVFDPTKEATYTGGGAKSVAAGAQTVLVDPLTQTRKVRLTEPVGGWTWRCTAAPGAAQTVVGVIVTDNADAVTLGGMFLAAPVTIEHVNDFADVDCIDIDLPVGFMGA